MDTYHQDKEQQIINSWHDNAAAWAKAIRNKEIASRTLITNQAVVDTVMKYAPQTVLDIGCGEGWLSHTLCQKGIQAMGIDVVPALIEQARLGLARLEQAPAQGSCVFEVCSYQNLVRGQFHAPYLFDAVVFNFSLFGEASAREVLAAVKGLLQDPGCLIIQTLHPLMACGDQAYRDGWRESSWVGFSQDFTNPAPWYFRTLQSWVHLFLSVGLQVTELIEPLHPATEKPASVIFVCKKQGVRE